MVSPSEWTLALFVPADRPERYARALAAGADGVVIDLEDAVGVDRKEHGRLALATADLAREPVLVRVNGAMTDWHERDLDAVSRCGSRGVMVPKADAGLDTAALLRRLPEGSSLVLLIETARGLADARALAGRAEVSRLAFGSIDFCADLGCAHTRHALLAPRAELVLASRLAGLPAPLDGVTAAIDDVGLIEDDARHAASLGFAGKLCIHPAQLAPARQGFAPSERELAWAHSIKAAGDGGAVRAGGELIDAPVRLRAERILRAALAGRPQDR